ncbi:hypothetical protein L1987_04067 [Smallanthus sonchifolius]|uniref:Uncharacterized protein n=1 Tax=Smallanthus sonchifolius TaxID=185202 RepID=A0ACB9KCE4_9ASTR|nr:hypothetical protein L1987_04067 [Smallanthus sonchifolius]
MGNQVRVPLCICTKRDRERNHDREIVGRRWSSGVKLFIDGRDGSGGGAHSVAGLDGGCDGCGHFSDSTLVPLFRQNQRILRFVLGFSGC